MKIAAHHSGRVDAVNEKVRLLRNDRSEAGGGHWLIVELADDRAHVGNRHASGAKIVLTSPGGVQTRWSFTGDARYIPIETSSRAAFGGSGTSVRLHVKPLIVSFGTAYHY